MNVKKLFYLFLALTLLTLVVVACGTPQESSELDDLQYLETDPFAEEEGDEDEELDTEEEEADDEADPFLEFEQEQVEEEQNDIFAP